jgi:hypothetical protein
MCGRVSAIEQPVSVFKILTALTHSNKNCGGMHMGVFHEWSAE